MIIDFGREHPGQAVLLIIVLLVIASLLLAPIIGKRLRDRGEQDSKPVPVDEGSGEDDHPAPGDRRWSNYFGSYIEMVHYSSDNQYWFGVLAGPHAGRTYKNLTRWSILPLTKPADYPRRKL
jgi:hypothetical protein